MIQTKEQALNIIDRLEKQYPWKHETNYLREYINALTAATAQRDEEVSKLVEALQAEAALLEAWARESREGGWGTHQVDPQRRRASAIRELLAPFLPPAVPEPKGNV